MYFFFSSRSRAMSQRVPEPPVSKDALSFSRASSALSRAAVADLTLSSAASAAASAACLSSAALAASSSACFCAASAADAASAASAADFSAWARVCSAASASSFAFAASSAASAAFALASSAASLAALAVASACVAASTEAFAALSALIFLLWADLVAFLALRTWAPCLIFASRSGMGSSPSSFLNSWNALPFLTTPRLSSSLWAFSLASFFALASSWPWMKSSVSCTTFSAAAWASAAA
mmetsp:Transcript_1568/g.2363  ORF Transcript_1568/g.2363 Transcript_1568/m.2363 type:complete len:240 (+) Transcript_1568:133-852(+)